MIHFLGITANKCLTTFIIRYHNIIPENPLTWIRTSYSFSMQDWDWKTRLQFNLCRVRRWRKSRLKKIQKLNLIHRSNYKSTFSTFIFQKLANKFKWAGAGSIETGRAAPCALHRVFPSTAVGNVGVLDPIPPDTCGQQKVYVCLVWQCCVVGWFCVFVVCCSLLLTGCEIFSCRVLWGMIPLTVSHWVSQQLCGYVSVTDAWSSWSVYCCGIIALSSLVSF